MNEPRDRGWLGLAASTIVVAVAVLAATMIFREQARRGHGGEGSSYRGDAKGARGLLVMLAREGIDVAARTRPVDSSLNAGLLVVINPQAKFDKEQADAIATWIKHGGSLLVACDETNPLLTACGLGLDTGTDRTLGLAKAVDAEYGPVAAAIATSALRGISGGTALYRRDNHAQAAWTRLGEGRVVAVADTFSCSNAGIDAADNIFFYLEAVRRHASGKPVLFLETHHGFQHEPSISQYFAQVGLGPVLLQLLLLGLLALWVYGARHAPVLAPSTLARRPAAEYAATMAHLYGRGNARAHAVQVAVEELARWRGGMSFRKGLRSVTDPAVAEKETDDHIATGRALATQRPLVLADAHHWIARAAALKKRTGDGELD